MQLIGEVKRYSARVHNGLKSKWYSLIGVHRNIVTSYACVILEVTVDLVVWGLYLQIHHGVIPSLKPNYENKTVS